MHETESVPDETVSLPVTITVPANARSPVPFLSSSVAVKPSVRVSEPPDTVMSETPEKTNVPPVTVRHAESCWTSVPTTMSPGIVIVCDSTSDANVTVASVPDAITPSCQFAGSDQLAATAVEIHVPSTETASVTTGPYEANDSNATVSCSALIQSSVAMPL